MVDANGELVEFLIEAGVVVTVMLVSVVVSAAQPWCETAVLVWWAIVIAHGWFLAGARAQRVTVRRQRLVALGVTVPVLLAMGLLRFDAFSDGAERYRSP
jgi:hypothetical protein